METSTVTLNMSIFGPRGYSFCLITSQRNKIISLRLNDFSAVCQVQGVGVFLPAADPPGPGPKDGGLAVLVDDSPQKRLLAQKATPPPSPLLSELLKKGNLISASPRLVRGNLAWLITSRNDVITMKAFVRVLLKGFRLSSVKYLKTSNVWKQII